MAIFDIKLPKRIAKALRLSNGDVQKQQRRVLKKLLTKARFTDFGQKYHFDNILMQEDIVHSYQKTVPIYNYNSIYKEWWHKTLEGKADICWPGKIKYYALSSGTSEASSKYLPITNDLLQGNKTIMIKQLLSLRNYTDVNVRSIGRGWLMLGGSTDLEKGPGYYAGDLSGISVKKSPFWFQPFYKPTKRISKEKDWNKKLEEIVSHAKDWDIAFIVGVPAWVQMCMEMVIERYHLNNIHEIWPNLSYFVHGGVSLEPYRLGFKKLLGKPIVYIETYLASEGFIAYQSRPNAQGGMKLVVSDHIFFEFVPFDNENFLPNGDLVDNPETLLVSDVQEGKDYALLISTPAGAWRYLLGDTVRFTDKKKFEVIISGRTKHFLSLVGEHLSVDNMNRALQLASEEMDISIPEFTVAGEPHGTFFAHKWFVACDHPIDEKKLITLIDENIKKLNDDYAVERKSALKDVTIKVLPEEAFLNFLASRGKMGAQHKFPRVLKGDILEAWNKFLIEKEY
ncbi:GH3 family domain-containing protein [Arachidicoccus soli]|uniref:GH3 auxin-responsive promoter n=1 Tax=Arachidicoccus soli TaxID=2341117 RepID=A0A386HQK0_9BACT|nr:GH3 auxin-responsive promoter family protein [Arachidicoccus soli]AYD48053.1 GH3 auxin-responsive promoter [Arachidicoccus soli]